jgi:DNA-binding transcriptional MerR regulator
MPQHQIRLYRIGEFARRAGITVRALHHYERLGLLIPATRSEAGYRHYRDSDLIRLQQIVTLKFLGLSLPRIRELLDYSVEHLAAALQAQHEAVQRQRDRLDRIATALQNAQRVVDAGDGNPEVFQHVIEVIAMQQEHNQSKEWVEKFYTSEQLETLRKREWTPEMQQDIDAQWKALIAEVEASLALDPASDKVQLLAERWMGLVGQFTQGDPAMQASLKKLYASKEQAPAAFKPPFSNEVMQFIQRAIAIHKAK